MAGRQMQPRQRKQAQAKGVFPEGGQPAPNLHQHAQPMKTADLGFFTDYSRFPPLICLYD